MTDDEIKTKRLSDWKPEADIKLQKALGKFVEEGGELLEKLYDFVMLQGLKITISPLEDELADCSAFIEVIGKAAPSIFDLNLYNSPGGIVKSTHMDFSILVLNLIRRISKALMIVGRCQIQGIYGRNPETNAINFDVLLRDMSLLRNGIQQFIVDFEFDQPRIEKRTLAKIESKLPWVMGTGTDLLPDIQDK